MYEQLGANFCSNFLNAHILAGYGMKSKKVKKKSGIKVKLHQSKKYYISSNKLSPLISTEPLGIHIE